MNIVIGITGSIAAYKTCILIRQFVKLGHEVQAVITPAGKEFITPITLSALTSRPVISDFFSQRDGTWHSHVQLGLWADAMVIAPATASTIGKMAHGIADNMLITTYLSMKAPVFVAPAMDLDMWKHPATQDNLQLLRQRGVTVIEPTSGELASHLVGKGRMEEPERIAEVVLNCISAQPSACTNTLESAPSDPQPSACTNTLESAPSDPQPSASSGSQLLQGSVAGGSSTCPTASPAPSPLSGKTVLITAGPTYERIDPVRFIGNYSSGKMGTALAEECARRGASVEIVCGPMSHYPAGQNINVTRVESAQQMWEAASTLFTNAQVAILCAAVADFTPDTVANQKLKREGDGLTLHLKPTPDIARGLGIIKRADQRLVGFALETHDGLPHAQAKLAKKHLDFIVLNSLNDAGAGFQHDTNKVTIVTPTGIKSYPLKAKTAVAADIIDELENIL